MDIKSLHRVAYRCKDAKQTAGPVDHTICKSIYFFDPNGDRLELAVEWTRTKKAPHHADWVHEK